jgi:hypothetical protein
MAAHLIDGILHFSVPEGWSRVELHGGVGFAPTHLFDDVYPIDTAPLSLFIQPLEHAETASFDGTIEALMGRRVRQGYPERFDAEVSGRPARGFGWTDGVADILSFFVCVLDRHFVEFSVQKRSFQEPPSPPLNDVARELLSRVRWTMSDMAAPSVESDELWEVWRQDDHGNRFRVSAELTHAAAERMCQDFEARGHRQLYWSVRAMKEAPSA